MQSRWDSTPKHHRSALRPCLLRPGPLGKSWGPGCTCSQTSDEASVQRQVGRRNRGGLRTRKREEELSCPSMQRQACSLQRVDERLLGELSDDRFNDPSQPKWHVTRQRYGSALDNNAAVTPLELPVGR